MTRADATWTGNRKKPGARPHTIIPVAMPSTEPLDEPAIKTAAQHGMTIRLCRDRGQVMQYGYSTMMGQEDRYSVLYDAHGLPLATTSLADRQSRALAARCARGTVVVFGLGMGTFLHSVLKSPRVERVFAFDQDQRVVDLIADTIERRKWEGADKIVTLRYSKGRDVTKSMLFVNHSHHGSIDFLYVDMWGADLHVLGRTDDVREVAEDLFPYMTGFHGQELVMVDWMRRLRSPPLWDLSRMNLDHFDEWCISVGITLGHRSMDYLDYARTCWAVQRSRTDHDAFQSVMKSRPPGPRWYTKSLYMDSEGKAKIDEVWMYAANELDARRLACRVLEDDFGMAKLMDMHVRTMR